MCNCTSFPHLRMCRIHSALFTSSKNIGSRCPPTVLQEGGTIGYEDKKAWIDTKCTDGWVTLAGPGELGNIFSALNFSNLHPCGMRSHPLRSRISPWMIRSTSSFFFRFLPHLLSCPNVSFSHMAASEFSKDIDVLPLYSETFHGYSVLFAKKNHAYLVT